MSKETMQWLNDNTLIGYTDKRGNAWHHRAGATNHFPGPIPVETVRDRLFKWNAVSSPVYIESADGEGFEPIPNKTAWVRDDTRAVLGVFSEGYQGHGYNEWLINNVASIVDTSAGDLAIGSAGLLKGGAVAWVQIETADTVKTEQGFDFRPFLLATTSFDGTVATQYGNKVQATVCDNTLEAALGEKGQVFKLKHTKNSGMKIADAREALKIIFDSADDFSAQVKALTETSVSDAQWAQFLDAHVPVPEEQGRGKTVSEAKRETLGALWQHDERVSPWKGTALGVLQAVNTFNTHEAIVRKVVRQDRMMQNVISGKLGTADADAMAQLNKILINA
jgi:phage/plasmid-like protein (TIGR03299 family)